MSFQKIKRKPTLAEEVAENIKESILKGEYSPGTALPTEPKLSEQFGVSRAVIRDAVRIVSALGLLDVQHGRGMFVTESLSNWFADTLLTTLRKEGASVWDVEQFEELLYPQVFALAAENILPENAQRLQSLCEKYIQHLTELNRAYSNDQQLPQAGKELEERLRETSKEFFSIIFTASGNKLLRILGTSTLHLRNFRFVEGTKEEEEKLLALETEYFRKLTKSIVSSMPEEAAHLARRAYHHSPKMISEMRKTPIGEKPEIPFSEIIRAMDST